MYDVAVVGARCAGSALALMLARKGLDVVMIDRATFPSDTMSGHYIQPAGVSCLRRLGLLDDLLGLGAPALTTMSIDFGAIVLSGSPAPTPDGTIAGSAPRRLKFDAMLAEAAVSAGAELRQGVGFIEPLAESGRVTGIRTTASNGRSDAIAARLVVGADGKRSRFAAKAGARAYAVQPARTCCFYAYWRGLDISSTRLFVRDGLFCVAFPTDDGLTFIAVAWPRADFGQVRADIGKAYRDAVATIPWLDDRLQSGEQIGRFAGTADLDGFFRTATGPGWALLGDAGYHKDPITAQGMTDALLHAELLAEAIAQGFSNDGSLDAALVDFGQRRDAMARPLYDMTADLARLAPPAPDMIGLVSALAGDPQQTSRFLGMMAGSVPIPAFFAPANLASITGRPLAA